MVVDQARPGAVNIDNAPHIQKQHYLPVRRVLGESSMVEDGGIPNLQGVKLLARRCPKSRAYENIC